MIVCHELKARTSISPVVKRTCMAPGRAVAANSREGCVQMCIDA